MSVMHGDVQGGGPQVEGDGRYVLFAGACGTSDYLVVSPNTVFDGTNYQVFCSTYKNYQPTGNQVTHDASTGKWYVDGEEMVPSNATAYTYTLQGGGIEMKPKE